MASSSAGTPRARVLGAALKKVREAAKVSARDVSRQLGVTHTTVGRWERGLTMPGPVEVSAFLAVLGVVADDRERILTLASGGGPDWLISGPPGISQQLAGVMECERTARRITAWEPLVVPGLLQTSDYSRTIMSAGGTVPSGEAQNRVMMRIARQDAVTRRRNPVHLDALIGEPVILNRIGGAGVMADQLRHLLAAAALDTVTVRVVSMTGGWHPGHAGPFILYEFDDAMPPIVYLEHHRSGAFLVDAEDVAAYQDAAEAIRRAAMSPDESAGLIADVIPDKGDD